MIEPSQLASEPPKSKLRWLLIPALLLLGVGTAFAVGGAPTTGTATACATASVPAQTISANSQPVGTIPGASRTQCATATYTIPTVTTTVGSTTVPPTTTSTVAVPVITGTAAVGSLLACSTSDPAPAYAWQNDASGSYTAIDGGTHTSGKYQVQSSDAGHNVRCSVNGQASAPVAVPVPVTTTTTTTTTPPGNGSIIYRGDFETGDIGQWNWGGQCSNTGAPTDSTYNRGTVDVSSTYAVQGSYGARVTLAADGSRRQACEVLDHKPLVVDTYYGLVFRFGTGNTTNSWGTATAQLNYQGIWGPPEGLFAINSTTESEATPDSLLMVLQSGFCNSVSTSNPGCTYVGSRYDAKGVPAKQYAIPPGQLNLGQWYDVVCHIHFATDSTGVYECWYRLKGASSWTLGGRYTGVPTVQWTSTPQIPSEDVDKIGAYRPQDSISQWVADLDGFVKGTSFDVVAATLP